MPSFKIIGLQDIFEGFYNVWVGRPSWHTCDISLFRRELPIFFPFLRKSPYLEFQNFPISLYISLFGISDLPIKFQEIPSLFNHSPYLEKKISLFVFSDVSHVCILVMLPGPFIQTRSPFQLRFHMRSDFDWLSGLGEDLCN